MKKKCLIISGILVIIFIIFALNLNNTTILKIDSSASKFILSYQNVALLNFSKIIAIIFDTLPIILIALIISFIFYIKSKSKQAIYFSSASVIAGALIYLLKEIISRPRPILQAVQETSFSFPSGHSTISTVFFGFILFLSLEKLKTKTQKIFAAIISLIIILIIGLTRIYLNVHWLTDVIGGYLLGAIIISIVYCLYKKH